MDLRSSNSLAWRGLLRLQYADMVGTNQGSSISFSPTVWTPWYDEKTMFLIRGAIRTTKDPSGVVVVGRGKRQREEGGGGKRGNRSMRHTTYSNWVCCCQACWKSWLCFGFGIGIGFLFFLLFFLLCQGFAKLLFFVCMCPFFECERKTVQVS